MESKQEGIHAAEQRVVAAAKELRESNQAWIDVAYRVEVFGQAEYVAARRRWMEADKEFTGAVDALKMLEREMDAI